MRPVSIAYVRVRCYEFSAVSLQFDFGWLAATFRAEGFWALCSRGSREAMLAEWASVVAEDRRSEVVVW